MESNHVEYNNKCPICGKISKHLHDECRDWETDEWVCSESQTCQFDHKPPCFWCKRCNKHFKAKPLWSVS